MPKWYDWLALKKSRKIALMLLACMALGLVCFWATRPKEPVYKGRRLSEWMMDLETSPEREAAAEEAIRHIGTNALPHLLAVLHQKSTRHIAKVQGFLERVPLVGHRFEPIEFKHDRVLIALRELGPLAKPAMPELTELLLTSTAGYSRPFSYEALEVQPEPLAYIMARLGPEAVAPLTMALTNRNEFVRRAGASGLASMGNTAKSAEPLLIANLSDESFNARVGAAYALCKLGGSTNTIVTGLLRNPRLNRNQIVEAFSGTYNALKPNEQEFAATIMMTIQEK